MDPTPNSNNLTNHPPGPSSPSPEQQHQQQQHNKNKSHHNLATNANHNTNTNKLTNHSQSQSQPHVQLRELNKKLQTQKQMPVFRSGDIIINQKKNICYKAIQLIGQGTFGHVLSVICYHSNTNNNSNNNLSNLNLCKINKPSNFNSGSVPQSQHIMALKIIKNQPAYIKQGLTQIKNLQQIAKYQQLIQAKLQQQQQQQQGSNSNSNSNTNSKKNYLKLYDGFMWKGHLCIAMQLLDNSILNILQTSSYKGLQMKWIQKWSKEILLNLSKMHKINIYHCDIKPQNIMFRPQDTQKPVLIDFSSSCNIKLNEQLFTYIQSRFYRSPQVLLGKKPYTEKIDIWSFGCLLVEMYLGLPIFPGGSSYDQIAKIYKILGNRFSERDAEMIMQSQFGRDYFVVQKKDQSSDTQVQMINTHTKNGNQNCQQLSQDNYRAQENYSIRLRSISDYKKKVKNFNLSQFQNSPEQAQTQTLINQQYFKIESFSDLIKIRNPPSKDLQTHQLFIDLIKKMLIFNPQQRISAQQAFLHPFIGGMFSQMEELRVLEDILEFGNKLKESEKEKEKQREHNIKKLQYN